MKNKFILFCFLSLTAIALNSCEEKFKYKNSPNAVTTLLASDVMKVSANVSGIVNTDNDSYITERGICYSTETSPTTSDSKTLDTNPGLGNFSCNIRNLAPSTTYYAKAYATNSYGTAYGKAVSFTTQDATIPIISSTTTASAITPVSARSGGVITNSGASDITVRGVCWSSENPNPTISDSKSSDGSGIGTYTSSLTSLKPNTKYYIRAYATNSVGTAYGDVKTFNTNASTIPVISLTTVATSITLNSASTGGSISDDGGSAVITRGVCFSSTTSTPTISGDKTSNGSGIGQFTTALTNLSVGTRYYVRAYATNSVGTGYGSVISFNTLTPSIANVVSQTAYSITFTEAKSGGTVINDGGSPVISRGVCWSSSTSIPTITNSSKTTNGSGGGPFESLLSGLTPNTTYYVRAYATNVAGTAYGSVSSFRTSRASLPIISSTIEISSITDKSALSGGTISSDGGASITSKGVCWSSNSSSPTINDSKTNDGSGTESFTSSLTGLTGGRSYYVRAYATNSAGTAYGPLKAFNTLALVTVGQSYQGGIVAYIFQSGDSGYISGETHGLIASSSNLSSGALWGCSGTSISAATNTAIGTGLSNTSAIVSGCSTSNIAASTCFNLSSGGYSDWYLPSRDELYKLYLNKSAIGGFASYYYWSSSQASSTSAWYVEFSSGSLSTSGSKNNSFYVRAIRKF